jgi:arylsulfatase A-like enzyme
MNVPLAVIGLPPYCSPPADTMRPVGHIDIVPTILEILGAPEGMSHQGVSLCGAQGIERPLFAVSRALRVQNAVILGAKKHVVSLDGYPEEAFDLRTDPTERSNLAAEPEFVGETGIMLQLFEQIQRKYYSQPEYWENAAPRYEGELLHSMRAP